MNEWCLIGIHSLSLGQEKGTKKTENDYKQTHLHVTWERGNPSQKAPAEPFHHEGYGTVHARKIDEVKNISASFSTLTSCLNSRYYL